MIEGLASWSAASLFVLSITYIVHRMLRSNRAPLNAITFLSLAIIVTTLFTLLMGLAGWLRPQPFLLISVIGLLMLSVVPATREAISGLPGEAKVWLKRLNYSWSDLPSWLKWLTAIFFAISVARFAFLVWALPPFVWDSLTYHLTNVAEWTQRGRIELFETSMTRIFTPANFEVLASWFTVFLHHDAVVELAGIPAFILAMAAVYAGIRGFNISRESAWIGAIAYGTTPALLLSTTGTKNDPHVAALYLSALAIIIDLFRRQDHSKSRNMLGQIITLVLIILYAAGTKAYIAHLVPGLVVVAAVGAWQSKGHGIWRRSLRNSVDQFRQTTRAFRLGLFALLVAGVFLGSYWNVRNWILTGNPFYPYGVEIEGQVVLVGAERDAELSTDRLAGNLKGLIYKFGDRKGRVSPDLTDTTGWGWFAYALGLPAVGWALWRRPSMRTLALGFTVSLLFLFMSTRPSPWSMRYVIWFPALFSYAFASFIEYLRPWSYFAARSILGLLVLTLALNMASMLNYGRISPEDFDRMVRLPTADRDAASLRINMPVEYEKSLAIVPRDALLGYNVHSNGFIYPLYRADLSQHLVYVPFSLDGTCEELAEAMSDRGTRYLFVAPEHSSDSVLSFLRRCGDSESIIRERSRGLYVIKQGK